MESGKTNPIDQIEYRGEESQLKVGGHSPDAEIKSAGNLGIPRSEK